MGRPKATAPIYGLQVAEGGNGYVTGDGEYMPRPPSGRVFRGAWIAAQERTIRAAFRDAARWGLKGRAFGSRARGVRAFELDCGANKKVHYINPGSWGLSFKAADRIQLEMRDLQRTCNEIGVGFRPTAAAWAMAKYRRDHVKKEPGGAMHQLPPAYRPMIIRGYYGGPIVMAKAQVTPSRNIDKVRAYAHCMETPVPVGRPIEVAYRSWEHLRSHVGAVEATVYVSDHLDLPPLPVRLERDGLIVYPTGTFRGVWTTRELAAMEERGDGGVLRVHDAVIFDARPAFAELMETLRGWEDDGFRWAKFATNAFTGKWAQHHTETAYCNYSRREIQALHPEGEIHEDSHGVHWVVDPEDLWGKRPPTYRPQISAWIVGHNRASVFDSVRRLRPGSVGYVHIDALWTSDTDSDPGPGWRCEGIYSRSRHYAAGIYSEDGGSIGHAGFEAAPTMRQLERAMRREQDSYRFSATENARRWTGLPSIDAGATSVPWTADELDLARRGATTLPRVDYWSEDWTEHGYPTPGGPYYSQQWARKKEAS